MWFIHDHHLILPEYLIEFDYAQNLPKGDSVYQFGNKLGKPIAATNAITSLVVTVH